MPKPRRVSRGWLGDDGRRLSVEDAPFLRLAKTAPRSEHVGVVPLFCQ